MRLNTVKRHLRESTKSLARNGWMSFASISAVAVTLLIVGLFTMIMLNLNKFATTLENDVEIRVHIDLITDETELKAAEDKLIAKIKAMPDVDEVVYSSKDEELKILIDKYGEEFSLHEQNNPLHSALYIKAKDPQRTDAIAAEIKKMDNVFEVKYGEETVGKLFKVLNVGRNVGLVLITGLLFTAMFLISNTIRITIVARRDEIEIMRLVGATNSFIRIPFVLEGMLIGIIGAIIPMIVVSVLYEKIFHVLEDKLKGEMFQLVEIGPLLFDINLILLGVGIFIGIWGSFMSVRKFLKI